MCVLMGAVLAVSMLGAAQENGDWRPLSSSAKGTTGQIGFSGERLYLNFSGYPIAQIRRLKPEEITSLFNVDDVTTGAGNLYRLEIPATKQLLHHNTLCGSEETQWMATFVQGKALQVAFFSGAAMPVLTPDALGASTNLCGTFSYVR